MTTLDREVRIAENVVFRELDGDAVIVNLQSGVSFGLDAVGTRIWQLCEQCSSLERVWHALQKEFDAPPEVLRADLLTFVAELSSNGLVTLH